MNSAASSLKFLPFLHPPYFHVVHFFLPLQLLVQESIMRLSFFLTGCALAASVVARSPQHVNKKLPERLRREPETLPSAQGYGQLHDKRDTKYIIPQNANTTKFAVNGSAIPDVPFDVGGSLH